MYTTSHKWLNDNGRWPYHFALCKPIQISIEHYNIILYRNYNYNKFTMGYNLAGKCIMLFLSIFPN